MLIYGLCDKSPPLSGRRSPSDPPDWGACVVSAVASVTCRQGCANRILLLHSVTCLLLILFSFPSMPPPTCILSFCPLSLCPHVLVPHSRYTSLSSCFVFFSTFCLEFHKTSLFWNLLLLLSLHSLIFSFFSSSFYTHYPPTPSPSSSSYSLSPLAAPSPFIPHPLSPVTTALLYLLPLFLPLLLFLLLN